MEVIFTVMGAGALYLAIEGKQLSRLARRRRERGLPAMEAATRVGFAIFGALTVLTTVAALIS